MRDTFLVTGALGCIGAWIARTLVEEGVPVVGYDVGSDRRRLELIMSPEQLVGVTLVRGDVTDLERLERVLDEHEATHVIHLAALLVPLARANPPLGAAINVVGATNVFEAVKRQRERVRGLAYASSAAVYDAVDVDATRAENALGHPVTLYGVHKQANEGTARVYWIEHGLPSIGLRPYVVYGPGRDQGMTAGPTLAMAAAAHGESYTIPWSSRCTFTLARDVARAFVDAARAAADGEGAPVYNIPGANVGMNEVVAAIEAAAPDAAGKIEFQDATLPFPKEFATGGFPMLVTPLADGVRETIELFRAHRGSY
ncbi:MAG TPA: NAD-dependent epimerase/dehydratase family protein [Gaiellaceae bacterium]